MVRYIFRSLDGDPMYERQRNQLDHHDSIRVILGTYEIDIQIFTEYQEHQSDINDLPFGPLHDILVYNNVILIVLSLSVRRT